MSYFDDILERANKLHSDANLGSLSKFPTFSKTDTKNALSAKFKFDSGLADIFRHSDEMWKQKRLIAGRSGVEASALTALKVSRDMNHLRATALPFSSNDERRKAGGGDKPAGSTTAFDETALGPSGASGSAYEEYSMREIERFVENSFERARIESERTFFNQQLADDEAYGVSGSTAGAAGGDYTTATDPFGQLRRGTPIAAGANLNQPLDYVEGVFAKKIDAALYKNCRAIIGDALREAVAELDDKEVTKLWDKAFAICDRTLSTPSDGSDATAGSGVSALRASRRWADHVTENATKFLQNWFKDHMEAIVENALEQANRGGVPGVLPLVEAYLNVKRYRYAGAEDGNYNNHPVWLMVFHTLRVGDFAAVGQLAKQRLFNNSRCSIMAGVLSQLAVTPRIDPATRVKLAAEWRQSSVNCADPFKRATYGVFLGFDSADVNGTIEEWLWSRLAGCRLNHQEMADTFRQLQTTVCAEFGEEYFVRQGGSYLLYYSALMLTGQIEQAVFALLRANQLVHAVHIAVLAYQLKLLVLTPKISNDILKSDPENPATCELNFARVVLRYMKNFELTNINAALNYSFFLNQLELDAAIDNKGGRNVFMSCVSRLVYLTGEKDQILGRLDAVGKRQPGLIDKFAAAFNVTDLICYVANDTNVAGDMLEACKLFALAERPIDAIKLTCRLLSVRLSAAAKCRDEPTATALTAAVRFAKQLAGRYQTCTTATIRKIDLSTMLTLIDLHTFFEQVAAKKYSSALDVIQRMECLPLTPDDVQPHVNVFENVAEEVRLLLPDVCVAVMRSIVAVYEHEPADSPQRDALALNAKALILYTAMVPYKFPVTTNSVILQLQSRIC